MNLSSANVQNPGIQVEFEIDGAQGRRVRVVTFPPVRDIPPVEPLSDEELRSIAFADADGWRCFYPASRGHLTAAEARAVMRAERRLPAETAEEAAAAEFLLTMELGWAHGEGSI